MTQPSRRLYLLVRTLLVLNTAFVLASAQADEYGDVKTLLRSAKPAEAMAKADQYLATKPRDPQMRFLKGVIQAESGKLSEAIGTFTKLSEDNPELPEPYNNLAVIHAGQGQFDKARAALEMAIRTNPSYATAHENLGDVYARLASQAYSKALQLDTSNTAVQPKLALIRELFAPSGKSVRASGQVVATAAPASTKTTLPVPAPLTPPPAPTKPAAPAAVVTPSAEVASGGPVGGGPASATSTKSAPASTEGSKDVEASVQAWAKAWAAKDLNGYFSAYGAGFAPPANQSRKAWEEDRRVRIMGKTSISVKLNDLQIAVKGHQATARFRQDYRADSLSISSRKTLTLVKTDARWTIVRESTGG